MARVSPTEQALQKHPRLAIILCARALLIRASLCFGCLRFAEFSIHPRKALWVWLAFSVEIQTSILITSHVGQVSNFLPAGRAADASVLVSWLQLVHGMAHFQQVRCLIKGQDPAERRTPIDD